MRDMLRMCLNWKVLGGLAAAGVGLWVVAPDLVGAALPVLLVLACPLSMFLMMRSMHRADGTTNEVKTHQYEPNATVSERLARLRSRLAATRAEEVEPGTRRRRGGSTRPEP